MKGAAAKEFFRTIKQSSGRFVAILIISLLGAGVFAGLRMSAPDIRAQGDQYFDATHLYDAMVVSTLGLDDESLASLASVEGVQNIMSAYNSDALVDVQGKSVAASIQSLPPAALESDSSDGLHVYSDDDDYLNRLILLEGSWPQSSDECVIGREQAEKLSLSIGDTLTLQQTQDNLDDVFDITSFTITGFIMAPAFSADITLGTTKLGGGTIELYLYVPEDAFDPDLPYTAAYLSIEGAADAPWGTSAYDDAIAPVIIRIQDISADITHDRTEAIRHKAQTELDDAWETYRTERRDAENSLEEAQNDLDDAHNELMNAEKKLTDAHQELVDAQRTLETSKRQLDEGEAAYQNGLAELNAQKEQYGPSLDALPALKQQYAALSQDPSTPPETLAQLNAQIQQLEQLKVQLEAAEKTLINTRSQLDVSWSDYNKGLTQYEHGVADYNKGIADYNEGRTSYEDGLDEFKDKKREAEDKFSDAESTLTEAQADIDSLEPTEVFVVDRTKNAGAASLEHDAQSIEQIATYFPFVFILVAALVILTSITRMVDEERLNIGTHKALGYGNERIIARYLLYSALASMIGGVIGVVLMGKLLPWFIMSSYAINYSIPVMPLIIDMPITFIALGITVGVALIASWAAAIRSLRETPAALMLPRAPKPGKRILLEKITPIWRRLSFSHKITARNLFRYKPRFFMAVIGIAGCTALLMIGFGLRDAIGDIVNNQYNELVTYDAFITMNEDNNEDTSGSESQEVKEARKEIRRNYRADSIDRALKRADIASSLFVYDANMIAVHGEEEIRVEFIVPSTTEQFSDYVTLRDRASKEPLDLPENSLVISEKTARELGVGPGDTIQIYEENLVADKVGEGTDFVVGAITENYLQHYIYVSPDLYEEKFGHAPISNSVFVNFIEGADQSEIAEELLQVPSISSIALMDKKVTQYEEMLQIMTKLILVVLLLAAALAFVVLYNLMNININERIREIATLKVLGFTPREVSLYIFREIFIMVVIGALIGCILGIPLTLYIAEAAETATMMFGRTIAPLSFVLSFVITLVFALMITFAMRSKLNHIDMVESLKSIE